VLDENLSPFHVACFAADSGGRYEPHLARICAPWRIKHKQDAGYATVGHLRAVLRQPDAADMHAVLDVLTGDVVWKNAPRMATERAGETVDLAPPRTAFNEGGRAARLVLAAAVLCCCVGCDARPAGGSPNSVADGGAWRWCVCACVCV